MFRQSRALYTLWRARATSDPSALSVGAKFESANTSVPGTICGFDQGPAGCFEYTMYVGRLIDAFRLASVPHSASELPVVQPTHGWPPWTGSLPAGSTAVYHTTYSP
eukprot:2741362-Prymnesium_polylepis.1